MQSAPRLSSGLAVLRRPVGATVTASVLAQVFFVLSGAVLARGLGPGDRGTLASIMLWPTVLVALGSLGLFDAVTVMVARRQRLASSYLSTALLLSAVLATASAVATWFILHAVVGGEEPILAARLYVLAVPLSMFTSVLFAGLMGSHRFPAFNALRVGVAGSNAALVAILWFTDSLTILSAVIVYLGVSVCTVAAAYVALAPDRPSPADPSRRLGRQLLTFGLRSHIGGAASILNQRTDQLAISAALPADQMGLYVVAVAVGLLPGLVANAVVVVALPSITRAEEHRRGADALRFVVKAATWGGTVAVFAIAATPVAVPLIFGPAFEPAVPAAIALLAANWMLGIGRTLAAANRGAGKPMSASAGEAIGLAFTVAALAILLPRLSILGAALATVVGYSALTVSQVIAARRNFGFLRGGTMPDVVQREAN